MLIKDISLPLVYIECLYQSMPIPTPKKKKCSRLKAAQPASKIC